MGRSQTVVIGFYSIGKLGTFPDGGSDPGNETSTMSKFAAFFLALLVGMPALAQFRKPEDAVKYRQSVMYVMGTSFYARIGAMVNGRIPYDPKLAQDHADVVVMMSRLPWPAFTPDTNGVGRTDAKPTLWNELPKFNELREKMQAEVLKLQVASRTGDIDALRAAYRATGAACKNCHDAFTNQ